MIGIGGMSSVRTRCSYRGTATATYYEPNDLYRDRFARFVRVTDGRGALLTEIAVARTDGALHIRHDDRSWWRPAAFRSVQEAVQVFACRYGVLG